jgi:uncharacterized membrane protein
MRGGSNSNPSSSDQQAKVEYLGDSMLKNIFEFLTTPVVQSVVWLIVLAVVLVVGYAIVKRFRDEIDDDRVTANELLTNFREMNREGDITDAEFRTIRTALGERLPTEVKDSRGKG